MKSIRLSLHARQQCEERGATEAEVKQAIERGAREAAKQGRFMYRLNYQYNAEWQGKFYTINRLRPLWRRRKMR